MEEFNNNDALYDEYLSQVRNLTLEILQKKYPDCTYEQLNQEHVLYEDAYEEAEQQLREQYENEQYNDEVDQYYYRDRFYV